MTRSRSDTPEFLFRALADRTRLRLLNLMDGQEICVCYFVGVLDVSQPKISRHLASLRKAGIVAARKDGKWMHYRIIIPADRLAARVLKETLQWLSTDQEMRRDLAALNRACRAPGELVEIEGAPLPMPVESVRS